MTTQAEGHSLQQQSIVGTSAFSVSEVVGQEQRLSV